MTVERALRGVKVVAAAAGIVALLAFPFTADRFWVVQIGINSLWLAIVAMSLVFLVRYAGMISLAQTALAGVAMYTIAILTVSYDVHPWAAVPIALAAAVVIGTVFAIVAVRTYGIYFLMITLAMGVFMFFFANQAHDLTRGHQGFHGLVPPDAMRNYRTFYFVALVAAIICLAGLRFVGRTRFGTAVQGIRDNPVRMRTLGFNVPLFRVLVFALAALVAGIGGVLGVWYNVRVSPGSIDLIRTINLLVIAVIGGLFRLWGVFPGAVVFTLLTNYANHYTDRYNTAIGLIFVVIVLLSPGGIAGIWERLSGWIRGLLEQRWFAAAPTAPGPAGAGPAAEQDEPSPLPTTKARMLEGKETSRCDNLYRQ